MDKDYYLLCFNNLVSCITMEKYDFMRDYIHELADIEDDALLKYILIKLKDKISERKRFIYINSPKKTYKQNYNLCVYMLVKMVFDFLFKWSNNNFICIDEYKFLVSKLDT